MEQKKVARINELAALAKERTLTAEELAERSVLRKEFLASVRANLVGQLDNVYFVDEDGNQEKLKKKS